MYSYTPFVLSLSLSFFLAMAKMTRETQLGLALFDMNPTLPYGLSIGYEMELINLHFMHGGLL